jgi:long-chain fatty acid transport protein
MRQKTFGLALAVLMASSSLAMAGGFAVREQSVVGQGSSFAGVAAGTGSLSSIFWNPAVSSEFNEFGFISENNNSLIAPQSESSLGSGNIGEWAVVPAPYASYAITDKLTVAASLNAPFGLTTDANDTWTGVIYGDKSAVRTYNLNPSASYKLNDMFSIGLGAQIEYMSVELSSRAPGAGTQVFGVKGDSIGVGLTAGILFEPTDTTDIGIGFRSSVSHSLKGDGFRLGAGAFNSNIQAKFKSPETVTIGIRQDVSDQLAVMAGVEWANWSRLKELRITNSAGAPDVVDDFKWKDSWFFSVGAQYAYSDDLTLRAGAAYEKSPVPDLTRGVRVPDNDRIWLSIGASYKFAEGWTANAAYSHVFIEDGAVVRTAPVPLNTEFEQSLDIVSVGLTRDW